MVLVLDSSFAMALAMDDEHTPEMERLLIRLAHEQAVVPPFWDYEIASAMLTASIRMRIPVEQVAPRLALLRNLPISVDMASIELAVTRSLDLARAHGLTVYDAAYLELGVRLQSTVATLDRKLAGAVRDEGLEVLGT